MKPSGINLAFGVILLALGLIWSIFWFEGDEAVLRLIIRIINLVPGVMQIGFYQHYCVHPRKPGEWEIWVPTVAILTGAVLLIDLTMCLLTQMGVWSD